MASGLASGSSKVPNCLLCSAPISNLKLRRNVSHGEGLKRKEILDGLLREASHPIITPRRQTQENHEPTKDSTRAQDSCKVNCECLKDEDIKSYLESSNVVCKDNCYPSLSKFFKLQQDMQTQHDKLLCLVQKSASLFIKWVYPNYTKMFVYGVKLTIQKAEEGDAYHPCKAVYEKCNSCRQSPCLCGKPLWMYIHACIHFCLSSVCKREKTNKNNEAY